MIPSAVRYRSILPYLMLIAALLGIQLALADRSQAATITVNTSCTLVDAIIAANTATPTGDCPRGSDGADTIVLRQDVILTGVHNTSPDGPNGLPLITSDITLLGNGFTISRSNAANTPDFRIFQIDPDARLRLIDLTLRNGNITGRAGRRGSHASQPGSDGENGERGSVGFVISGPGGPGEDGGEGNAGGNGGSGGAARGGAVLNRGTLELERCAIIDSAVLGGSGGPGGNGSAGGTGGEGGPPGIPIPLIIFAILGPGGPGGDGGVGGMGGSGGSGGHGQGGAIYNAGGTLSVRSCTFEKNRALGGSGGAGGRGSTGGEAGIGGLSKDSLGPGGQGGQGGTGGTGGDGGNGQGGAIYNAGGTITVRLSSLRNNRAQGGASGRGGRGNTGGDGGLESGDGGLGGPGGPGGVAGNGQGGAIYSESGDVMIARTMLVENHGQGGPGGAGNNAGAAGDGSGPLMQWTSGLEEFTGVVTDLILDSIITEGSIGGVGGDGGVGGSGQGGSVFTTSGTLTVTRSTLAGSVTLPGSGGTGGEGGLGSFPNELMRELELRGVGPGGNGHDGTDGSGQGGGTYIENSQLDVLRSTFTSNRAGEGGAIWQRSAEAEAQIISSTIANNTADSFGGGLDAVETLSLGSTIVAENTAPAGPDINGAINSLDYNLIGDPGSAMLNGRTDYTLMDTSANLNPLEDNGGPTQTMALQISSPAINRGRCVGPNDQRGYFLIDDYCDIGAFEFGASSQPPAPLPPVLVGAPGNSIRAVLPARIYASVIASDGVFYRSAAEVGIQGLIDLGVVHAVDIFSLSDASAVNAEICLRGAGAVFFLDATGAPRVPGRLSTTQREGFTCAWIAVPGTIVQVEP